MNSTFGMYFAFLTAAMVLYYAVVICMDLFKKDKNARDDSEEFEAPHDEDEEPSTSVSLEGGEVRFGGPREPENQDEDGSGDTQDDDLRDDDAGSGDDDIFDDAPEAETAFNNYDENDESGELTDEQVTILQQQLSEGMEAIEPEYETVVDSTEFHFIMGSPKGRNAGGVLRTYDKI